MKRVFSVILILLAGAILFLQTASAQALLSDTKGLKEMTDTVATTAHFGNVEPGVLVARVIQIVLGFLGIIFLILIIISGFNWMMAGGNEEQIKTAQGRIKNAIIGLVIVLAAYAITYFIFKYLPFSSVSGPQPGGSN